jgi:hypothetical protein
MEARVTARLRPLWICPICGRRFVTANTWHPHEQYRLSDHFAGKDPQVHRLFDQYLAVLRSFGPVTVYAQKAAIVFQGRVRFAHAAPRKHWLAGDLWLKRRAQHPLFHRIEQVAPRDFIHYFRLTRPEDLDEGLEVLLRESYRVGRQEET